VKCGQKQLLRSLLLAYGNIVLAIKITIRHALPLSRRILDSIIQENVKTVLVAHDPDMNCKYTSTTNDFKTYTKEAKMIKPARQCTKMKRNYT
jgi:hypothetical protein